MCGILAQRKMPGHRTKRRGGLEVRYRHHLCRHIVWNSSLPRCGIYCAEQRLEGRCKHVLWQLIIVDIGGDPNSLRPGGIAIDFIGEHEYVPSPAGEIVLYSLAKVLPWVLIVLVPGEIRGAEISARGGITKCLSCQIRRRGRLCSFRAVAFRERCCLGVIFENCIV